MAQHVPSDQGRPTSLTAGRAKGCFSAKSLSSLLGCRLHATAEASFNSFVCDGGHNKRALMVAFAFLLSAGLATAQTINEELDRLREHLGVPPNTQVKLASSSNLPVKTPLKVYVATGLHIKVRDKVAEWIQEWNKDEATKLGNLEQVSYITDADIILSRDTLQEKVSSRTASSVGSATVYDPASCKYRRKLRRQSAFLDQYKQSTRTDTQLLSNLCTQPSSS